MKDKVQKSSLYCQSLQKQKEVKLELEVRSSPKALPLSLTLIMELACKTFINKPKG